MKIAFSGSRDRRLTEQEKTFVYRAIADGFKVLVGDFPTGVDYDIYQMFPGAKIYHSTWRPKGVFDPSPKRNARMIADADMLIAFPGAGNGTRGCIKLAQRKPIPTLVWEETK